MMAIDSINIYFWLRTMTCLLIHIKVIFQLELQYHSVCFLINNVLLLLHNQKSSPAGLVLEFEMCKHFDIKQKSKSFTLCDCVCDCMVYPDPKFLTCKTKIQPHFFLKLDADYFDPIFSRKKFATNSSKYTFVRDVWFHGQIVCCNIQSTPSIQIVVHIDSRILKAIAGKFEVYFTKVSFDISYFQISLVLSCAK